MKFRFTKTMQPSFEISFETGATAKAIFLAAKSELEPSLRLLGLLTDRPTLVIVGGASGLADGDLEKLRSLFQQIICPFVEAANFTVIDGGTDAGVMQLMGQARQATGSQFPLVGVVVEKKAILPDRPIPSEDAAALEPHHTHFILVPGCEWGNESDWIAETATLIAQEQPSLTLLINGGAIALHQDVPNSLKQARPVLVVEGSGRSADRLAEAMTGTLSDPEVQKIVDSGLLYKVELAIGGEGLKTALQEVLGWTKP